jgi:hypothetical protein
MQVILKDNAKYTVDGDIAFALEEGQMEESAMARVRSPNYPQFGLPDALDRVKRIHAAENHLAAPKDVIARHLGYKGLNGASGSVISAIMKYGLLDETVSGDRVKVSPLALSILYPSRPEEKVEAIKKGALNPPLFSEIYNEWEGAQPSDENLRSYLIRKNFASDALDRVIQSYKETMELVTREAGEYVTPESGRADASAQGGQDAKAASTATNIGPSHQTVTITWIGRRGMSESSIAIKDERIELAALLYDQEGVQKVIDRLNAVKTILPEKLSTPSHTDDTVLTIK